ncbi:LAMI_0F13696g1_1 [Lachancea mirantina]|uniref:Protein SWT21 n=1 Tax=Lachancea mirantina TaxID=1230905 RepID=A0A1G4K3I9_9SACH|nr:LAMI_0F13696g1_1 [Lachancea mirantina]
MSHLRHLFDTSNTFHHRDVKKSWNLEVEASKTLSRRLNYEFPELERSVHSNEYRKPTWRFDFRQPIICEKFHWSRDGASFMTVHNDLGIRQYLLPEDTETSLVPFKRFFRGQSIMESCVHPQYSLFADSCYNLVLLSCRDLPIQLFSLSGHAEEHPALFRYDVANPLNDRYEPVYSLAFWDDVAFLAGMARNKIALYDLNKGDAVREFQCRRDSTKSFLTAKSIVSSFNEDASESSKTFRYLGTYKSELYTLDPRSPSCYNVSNLEKNHTGNGGVTQLLSSLNGHFLYVVTRNSDRICVLDTRQNCSLVNELVLPFRIDSQKFKGSINVNGLAMGTADGCILQWDSDFVEFGGLSRHSTKSEDNAAEYTLTGIPTSNGSRLNIVACNPENPNMIGISYSSDKFDTTKDPVCGISIDEII